MANSIPNDPGHLAAVFGDHQLSLSTRAMHADDYINTHRAVAPPLSTSTTFRYKRNEDSPTGWGDSGSNAADSHIYSRESNPNTTRLEALLSSLLGAPALTYASGLAAFHAMIVFLNPRRVAIGDGYHGCHGVLDLLHKLGGLQTLHLANEADLALLQPGDVIHVETPVNPTGEACDLAHYATIAKAHGCYLTVDSTFAPPPLQDPFAWGADIVMHSGTKYFGGHSDMLCGVLAIHPRHVAVPGDGATAQAADNTSSLPSNWIRGLLDERVILGAVMGSLEGWLGVRSLRTLELRVKRQSDTATHVIRWLVAEQARKDSLVARVVDRVLHASQQKEAADPDSWLYRQMPHGFGSVFSLVLREETAARRLPSTLELFHHATSVGGVESLIEWRALADKTVDRRLLRVNIGMESWEDLILDLERGFATLVAEAENDQKRNDF